MSDVTVICDHNYSKIAIVCGNTAYCVKLQVVKITVTKINQEGLAVASIARDVPSTLPGDDPFPRAH